MARMFTDGLTLVVGAFLVLQVVACGDKDGTDKDTGPTIQNTAPTVSGVVISPTTAYTNDTLTASASVEDADGDSLTVSYDWYVDGTLAQSGAIATLSGATAFDKDEAVEVTLTVDDGTDSASASSSALTISNTAPTAPVVSIDPEEPQAGADDLICLIDTSSSDDDADSISYSIEWDVDGTTWTGSTYTTYETDDTIDGADTDAEEEWTCTVTPNDGDEDGDSASASVEIEASQASCLAILESGGSTGDGVYEIHIDDDSDNAIDVYCDMTSDDRGWTMVASAVSGETDFVWNDDAALNEGDSGDDSAHWHLSADDITSIASEGEYRAGCGGNDPSNYWTGVSTYTWSAEASASTCYSEYDLQGTSYPTSWQPTYHLGVVCVGKTTTSHGDNGYSHVTPWYCDGSHTTGMIVWAR